MNEDKELELQKIMHDGCNTYGLFGECPTDCKNYDKDFGCRNSLNHIFAENLYWKGYIKQPQAKWVNASNKTTFKCSNCGAEPMYSPSNGMCFITLSEYCPYCGAKMELEDDDE